MVGVKGSGGPPPKRSDQRRRTNKPVKGIDKTQVTTVVAAEVVAPEPDPEWHPVATRWFKSLGSSGQSVWYTDSDWATAWVIAESISRELHPRQVVVGGKVRKITSPISGATLAQFLRASTVLLATEGDRRRLAVELQRPAPAGESEGGASVSELDEYRRRFGDRGGAG